MKANIIICASILAIIMATTACRDDKGKQQELNAVVEQIKATTLPLAIDELTLWKDMIIEDDAVVYVYDIIDPTGKVTAMLNNNHDNLLTNIGQQLSTREFHSFITLVVATGRSLKYQYTDPNTHLGTTITITHTELATLLQRS